MLEKEVFSICLEELARLHRVASCNVVKRQGRDIVGLAFANQSVVFQNILRFGLIALGISVKWMSGCCLVCLDRQHGERQ
jgi:hypothetical protein